MKDKKVKELNLKMFSVKYDIEIKFSFLIYLH